MSASGCVLCVELKNNWENELDIDVYTQEERRRAIQCPLLQSVNRLSVYLSKIFFWLKLYQYEI
jgi:hypothetical protein